MEKREKIGNLQTREQILEQLFKLWRPECRMETVSVNKAKGRVLGEDLYATCSIPVVRASKMDGIAVRYEDFAGGIPDTTMWKIGDDYVWADTGDDFSDEFDTVIPIEYVTIHPDGTLELDPMLDIVKGMNIRGRGTTVSSGSLLARKNQPLSALQLASIHISGITEISVKKKPKVGFIPTGSELIIPGAPLTRGRNYNGNNVLAQEMLKEMGAAPLCYHIVSDNKDELEAALDRALQECDIVVINGGSSKGSEDYSRKLLEKKGELICYGAATFPGKPLSLALIDKKAAVNLPGPPVAAFFGLDWCIRGIVNHMLQLSTGKRPTVKGVIKDTLDLHKGMEMLCMMDIKKTKNGYEFTRRTQEESIVEMLRADGYFVTPLGIDSLPEGSEIEIQLLTGEEFIKE